MKGEEEETLQTIGLCQLCAPQLFHSMTHTAQNLPDNRTLSLQLGQPKIRRTAGHYPYSSDNPNSAGQPDIITTARTTQNPPDNRTLCLQLGQPQTCRTTGNYHSARTTQTLPDNRKLSLQFGQPKPCRTTGHYHYSSVNLKPAGQPDIITTARST